MSGQYHVELRPRSLKYIPWKADIKRCGMFCFTPESGHLIVGARMSALCQKRAPAI